MPKSVLECELKRRAYADTTIHATRQARLGRKLHAAAEFQLKIDDLVKGFAVIAIAASVLGYIVLSYTLASYGVAEPSLLNTRMVAAGLVCLVIFVGPSLSVPFCFNSLAESTPCRPIKERWLLHLTRWQICLSCAFFLSLLILNIGALDPPAKAIYYCRLVALAFVVVLVYQLWHATRTPPIFLARTSIRAAAASLALIGMIAASLVLWPRITNRFTDGYPVAYILSHAMANSLAMLFGCQLRETRYSAMRPFLLVTALAWLPLYSTHFYGFLGSGWGGGQSPPVWLDLNKKSGVLEPCLLSGEIIFQTESSVYFHLTNTAHLAYQIPRSSISGIAYRRPLPYGQNHAREDFDPPYEQRPEEQSCRGGVNMGSKGRLDNRPGFRWSR